MTISKKIINLINYENDKPSITFLCIGTSNVIGDSLGPIIGTKLEKFKNRNNIKNIRIIGNLENNYNFLNYKNYNDDIVIAIDSAVSNTYRIGDIIIDKKRIDIRRALNNSKEIKSNISIKGVVGKNYKNSYKNFYNLKNTDISIVKEIAEIISNNLYEVINYYNNE